MVSYILRADLSGASEHSGYVIAANGEMDADCSLPQLLLAAAGEVLGTAAMCLTRGRSCRPNLLWELKWLNDA